MTETSFAWPDVAVIALTLAFFAFVVWCDARQPVDEHDAQRVIDELDALWREETRRNKPRRKSKKDTPR